MARRRLRPHPLVAELVARIAASGRTHYAHGLACGLGEHTIKQWRQGHQPSLANFDRALQPLGLRLAILPIEEGRGGTH